MTLSSAACESTRGRWPTPTLHQSTPPPIAKRTNSERKSEGEREGCFCLVCCLTGLRGGSVGSFSAKSASLSNCTQSSLSCLYVCVSPDPSTLSIHPSKTHSHAQDVTARHMQTDRQRKGRDARTFHCSYHREQKRKNSRSIGHRPTTIYYYRPAGQVSASCTMHYDAPNSPLSLSPPPRRGWASRGVRPMLACLSSCRRPA
mmetsp:Transcript_16899/g.48184  ORF Transcript_16899/g.48184 Transcript_16899/m.48184 type:complete len:202 (+) Transcript_16899:963-1568(+)